MAVKLVPQLIQSYNMTYNGPIHLHPFRFRLPKRRTYRNRLIPQEVDVAVNMSSEQKGLPPVLRRPSSVIND